MEKLENATRRSIKHIASFLRGSWKAVHEEEDEEDERGGGSRISIVEGM